MNFFSHALDLYDPKSATDEVADKANVDHQPPGRKGTDFMKSQGELSPSSSYRSACSGHTIPPTKRTELKHGPNSRMSRLKRALLSSTRRAGWPRTGKSIHRYRTREEKEHRKNWLSLEKELHRTQGLASWSVQESDPEALSNLLRNLCSSLSEACSFLLDGAHGTSCCDNESNPFRIMDPALDHPYRSSDGDKSTGGSLPSTYHGVQVPKYYIWPSTQAARFAVLQDALSMTAEVNNSGTAKFKPLVLLVTEKVVHADSCSRSELGSDSDRTPTTNPEQESFVSGWSSTICDMAEVITVVVESPDRMRNAIESILTSASQESSICPALVVLHSSMDSAVMTDISSVRNLCDSFGLFLCVEGSALAMTAQPGRPSDPDEAVSGAHFLILDPGMWFGFKACAIVSRNQCRTRCHIQEVDTRLTNKKGSHALNADLFRNQDMCGLIAGPALNLWTVISRMGVEQIRARIDEVTSLTESFVHLFDSFTNIQVQYDGIGCIIRISYSQSRENRMMERKKAAESISAVNKIIYTSLFNESAALGIQVVQEEDVSYLQFSPCRILNSGTLWVPRKEQIEAYVQRVKETVHKYEFCKAGFAAFEERVARCPDLELVTNAEVGPAVALCFGAFRVVPCELGSSWRDTSSSMDVVNHLTHQLVSQLSDSVGKTVSNNIILQRELERLHFRAMKRLHNDRLAQERDEDALPRTFKETNGEAEWPGGYPIPLEFYMNSELSDGIQDYVSIEPQQTCRPVDAVRYARVAADLATEAVEAITSAWREVNMISQIPRDLANVSGKENFIPLAATRKDLGCSNYILEREENRNCGVPEESRLDSSETNSSCPTDDGFPSSIDEGDSFCTTEELDDADKVNDIASIESVDSGACTTQEAYVIQQQLTKKARSAASEKSHSSVNEPGATHGSSISEPDNFMMTRQNDSYHDCDCEKSPGTSKPQEQGCILERELPVLGVDQKQVRSNWLGRWTGKDGAQKSTKKSASTKRNFDEEDAEPSSDEDWGEEEQNESRNEGGDPDPSSSSSLESSEDDGDGSSDSEETDSEGESSEGEESNSSESTAEVLDVEVNGSNCSADEWDKRGEVETGGHRLGLLGWLRRDSISDEEQNESEEDEGRSADEVDTQLSEVPTDWSSRESDEERQSQDDEEVTERQNETARGGRMFGFDWLRRGHSKPAKGDGDWDESENESGPATKACESSEGESESESGSNAENIEEWGDMSEGTPSEYSDEESVAEEVDLGSNEPENQSEDEGWRSGEEWSHGSNVSEVSQEEGSESSDESDSGGSENGEGNESSGSEESHSTTDYDSESESEVIASIVSEDVDEQVEEEGESRLWRYVKWLRPQWNGESEHGHHQALERVREETVEESYRDRRVTKHSGSWKMRR